MLYAGNNIKARRIFERTVTHRPPIRLTIRQGSGRGVGAVAAAAEDRR